MVESMNELSVKEVALELNVSDKAVYKRIGNEAFKRKYIKKVKGKTYITKDGLDYLRSVTKKKNEVEEELALTSTATKDISNSSSNEEILIYTSREIDIIKMLKGEVEYLKNQLEQQNFNHQEQLKLQVELQKDTIKSKDTIILNMQELIRSEQDTSKKILSYDERAKEVDNKLLELREELNKRKNVKRKSILSFFTNK